MISQKGIMYQREWDMQWIVESTRILTKVHPKLSKSARIQKAKQRLADIFDVIEGGKIKDVKYYDDPPLEVNHISKSILYEAENMARDTAAGGAVGRIDWQ